MWIRARFGIVTGYACSSARGLRGPGRVPLLDRPEDDAVRAGTIGAGLVVWSGAVPSSLCCVLPLTVIVLGLGSGAFMAVTMRYRWLLIPAGVLGVAAGVRPLGP